MEAYLTLKKLPITIKSKRMKDTAPAPDGIPYSVRENYGPWQDLWYFMHGTNSVKTKTPFHKVWLSFDKRAK